MPSERELLISLWSDLGKHSAANRLRALTDEEFEADKAYAEDRHRSQTEGLPSGPVYRNLPSSHGRFPR